MPANHAMINILVTNKGVAEMSRSRSNQDVWDQIFDDLILETEPPIRYIKDAIIITKNGVKFKVTPDEFATIAAKERQLDPEQSEIQSCSLSIDFTKVKRDINRWTKNFVDSIEADAAQKVLEVEAAKKRTKRRTATKKVD